MPAPSVVFAHTVLPSCWPPSDLCVPSCGAHAHAQGDDALKANAVRARQAGWYLGWANYVMQVRLHAWRVCVSVCLCVLALCVYACRCGCGAGGCGDDRGRGRGQRGFALRNGNRTPVFGFCHSGAVDELLPCGAVLMSSQPLQPPQPALPTTRPSTPRGLGRRGLRATC